MDDNTQRTTQSNAIIDLSGIQGNASSENPYDNLIEASDGLPVESSRLHLYPLTNFLTPDQN